MDFVMDGGARSVSVNNSGISSISLNHDNSTAGELAMNLAANRSNNNNSHCVTFDCGQSLLTEVGHQPKTIATTVGQQLENVTAGVAGTEVRWPSLSAITNNGDPQPLVFDQVPIRSDNNSEAVIKIRKINYPESNTLDPSPSTSPRASIHYNKDNKCDNIINLLDFDTSLVGLDQMTSNSVVTCSTHPLGLIELNISECNENASPSTQGLPSSLRSLTEDRDEAFLDFEMSCTAQEIAKVLETFNAILDGEESTSNLNLDGNESKSGENYLQIVDTFANLLIGEGDTQELLVIVDDNDNSDYINIQNESFTSDSLNLEADKTALVGEDDEDEEEETAKDEDEEYEYPDVEDIEGYESDRPMVRASMRKLRPVQMLPMPHHPVVPDSSSSYTIPESPCPSSLGYNPSESPLPSSSGQQHPPAGLATTLNSPVTNRILVTSLINNIMLTPSDGTGSPTATGYNHGSITDSENYYETHPQSRVLSQCTLVSEVSNPLYGEVTTASSSSHASGTHQRNDLNHHDSGPSALFHRSNLSSNNEGFISAAPASADSVINLQSSSPANSSSTSNTEDRPGGALVNTDNTTNITSAASLNTSSSGTASNNNTSSGSGGSDTTRTSTARTSQLLGPGLRMPAGRWPHRLSSVLALIGCTLGLNTICRFSLLSVEYGANFILQFLFLSLVFGVPLFTFHMSIGQYLSSGVIDMWRISPIFQGIGIGLVISQAMVGIYTAVGVSWVFIYFRDSFITRYEQYRWGKCLPEYRGSACDSLVNNMTNYAESVPDYFNGVVLQRSSPDYPSEAGMSTSLKFTVAFNLAVVWMLVFVSLSKGLKSYGKVIHGFVLIPVATMLVLASKMVGLVPADQASSLFGQTEWESFFFSSQTWIVAAREAFFTWGLLGACVMQVTSHNRFTHSLKSDASIVVLITTFVLLLSAFLGNACYSVIKANNFNYVPSSFESGKTYQFMQLKTTVAPDSPQSDPYVNQHISFLMGVRIVTPEMLNGKTSGYQSLRLVTELFPATMALLGHTGLSPFWTVLFYFTCILFGIAQQIAIWHSVIRGVIAIKSKVLQSWETTITFCVCAMGFVLGLPLCTEVGIFIEYFLDYAIGSGWWIMVLYLLELVAVFIVRGAPYCGENIVTVLVTGPGKLMAVLAPLVSFIWNVILPVAMLVLAIASFKSGNIRELYDWNPNHGYEFWPSWTKELGSLLQLLPILAVPFVAIIQSCRYLTNGPPDLFDRMQQLYRPTSRGLFGRNSPTHSAGNTPAAEFPAPPNGSGRSEDPPPKYTPPPSYSTATGAKIAKFLRSSFRRSMRRLGGGPSTSTTSPELPPPPNYASVIMEINAQQQSLCNSSTNVHRSPSAQQQQGNDNLIPILLSPTDLNSSSPDDGQLTSKKSSTSQTLGRSLGESKERSSLRRIASDITPRDIARLLRASFRRGTPTTNRPEERNKENNSNQNNLNYNAASQPSRIASTNHHHTLNIEQDFLRVTTPHPSIIGNFTFNINNSSSSSNYHCAFNSGAIDPLNFHSETLPRQSSINSHMRSSSSGAALMAAASHQRGQSETTDSQLTLISHSSSQNDLSRLTDNPPLTDFRLGGIPNPSFQFLEPSLHRGRNSLNQSDA